MPTESDIERMQHAAEAVKFLRRSPDQVALANGLKNLAYLERQMEQLDAALQHYEEAADIYRSFKRSLLLAHAIRHVGDIHQQAGRPGAAEPFYTEAIEIYRREPAALPLDLANAIRGMALAQGDLGKVQPAKLLWQEARDLYASEKIQAGVDEAGRQLSTLAGANK